MNDFVQKRILILLGTILLVTFFVFSPCLSNGFTNWDDPEYLLDNTLIRDFSRSGFKQIFLNHLTGKYHPLSILTYAVEYRIFALNPHNYHLDSIILHLVNCLLVFVLVRKFSKDNEVATITTFIFAVHPLQVEAVAWITSRKDLLYTFFYLSALIYYIRYSYQIKHRAFNHLIVFALFLLSLLSKITAVTLPLTLVALDIGYHKEFRLSYLKKRIPFFITAFLFGIITLYLAKISLAFPASELVSKGQRIVLASHALVYYLFKFVLPLKLSAFYPLPKALTLGHWLTLFIWPLLASAFFLSFRRNRLIFSGLCFFLITLFPALHVFEMNDSLIYDRFMYLPILGLALVLAVFLKPLLKVTKGKKSLVVILTCFYFIFLTVYSNLRCFVWKDSFSLWQNVIFQFPQAAMAYHNLGFDFQQKNDFNIAFALFEKTIELEPRHLSAHFNKGNILARWRRYDEAIQSYSKILSMNPNYIGALNNRGNMYFLLGDYRKALSDYNRALEIQPKDLSAYKNRGMLFYIMGEDRKSLLDFQAALVLAPKDVLATQKKAELENKLSGHLN